MRLLWLTDDYLPHRGGSRVVFHNICRNINGATVSLVTRRVEGSEDFDSRAGYRIERVRIPFHKIAALCGAEEIPLYLPFLWKTLRNAFKDTPDVIHCGEQTASGLVAHVVRKITGVPYIVWLHDNPFGPVSRFRYPVKRRVCLSADGIATSCSYARDAIIREGVPPGRVGLIRPGVDTSAFRPSAGGERVREKYGIRGKKVLLTISRIVPHKGQDTVVKSLPRLVALHPDLVYLIGGGGPYREAVERLARSLGVGDRVVFTGFIPQEEMADYYNACDLFVMLNREVDGLAWEGFGIVFLEASACGKPVIGGRAGGVGDSIIDGVTGFLVKPEDVDEIVERVDLILRDCPRARAMGTAGADRARNNFSWEESARMTVAFSEKIVRIRMTGGGDCRDEA